MKRIPLKDGDEYDAFHGGWRKALRWPRGEIGRIKSKYRRRFRQKEKRMTKAEVDKQ